MVGNQADQRNEDEMKTTPFSGTIETAYGQKVIPAISFNGTFEAYESYAEVPEGERLDENDMLKAVNNARKAAAKTAAANKLTEGYKPDEKTAAMNTMVKAFAKLYNIDEASARALVEAAGSAAVK